MYRVLMLPLSPRCCQATITERNQFRRNFLENAFLLLHSIDIWSSIQWRKESDLRCSARLHQLTLSEEETFSLWVDWNLPQLILLPIIRNSSFLSSRLVQGKRFSTFCWFSCNEIEENRSSALRARKRSDEKILISNYADIIQSTN